MPNSDDAVPKVNLEKPVGNDDLRGQIAGKVNLSKSATTPSGSEAGGPASDLRPASVFGPVSGLNPPPGYYGGGVGVVDVPNRSMRLLTVAGLLVVAAVALFGIVILATKHSADGTATGSPAVARPAPAQPCATPPEIAVHSLVMSASGLTANVELTASCDSGDVITDQHFGVTVTDGSRDVAAGAFDLRADPIVIPQGGTVERAFTFPPGMFWRTSELVSSAEATAEPSGSAGGGGGGAVSNGATTLIAAQPIPPRYATVDDAALSSLRDLAAVDRGAVARALENLWVPQISSKRPGLVAEGLEWSAADILREHLSLRERYSDVRLVWSGDWSTFNGPDWWVTVVGEASADPESAIRWCARNGLDADHCYAKVISSTRGVEGTTILQK